VEAGTLVLLLVLSCGELAGFFGFAMDEGIPPFVLRADAYEAREEPVSSMIDFLASHPDTLRRAWETVPESKQWMCDRAS
jgi:hypothetical protein